MNDNFYFVSIPSIAGQRIRPSSAWRSTRPPRTCFNPLNSGATHSTAAWYNFPWKKLWKLFQSPQ